MFLSIKSPSYLLILYTLVTISSIATSLLVSAQQDTSPPSTIRDERVENIVVFGDSYSDAGNKQRLTNGPLWNEDLAVGWNASLYNFAFSGAVCDNDLYPKEKTFIPSITDQVEMFYKQQQANNINIREQMEETVFIFWVGLNDIFKITSTGSNESPDEQQQYNNVVECIGTNIRNIRKIFGANKFIVFGIPPFEKMPYYSSSKSTNGKNKDIMEKAANQLNELLVRHVEKMNKHLQYLELDLVDVHKLITDIVSQPAIFDLKNAQDAYWDVCQGQCKDDVNSYVWWDQTHLTGGIHRLIANSILMAGSLAPETYLADEIDVEAYLYEDSNSRYKSPKFKAARSTGEINRVIQRLNEEKLSEEMNHIITEQEEILLNENSDDQGDSSYYRSGRDHIVEFSHIYLMMSGFIFIFVGFLLFLKKTRRRGAANMNALSSLIKKNNYHFRPLRNMDNEV